MPPGARARALAVLGMTSGFQHEFRRAAIAADEAAAIAAEAADRRGLPLARLTQRIVTLNTGATDAAVAWEEASIALYRALGTEGDLDTARALPHFAADLAAHHRAGELWHAAWCLEGVAMALTEAGPESAARLLGAADALRTSIGAPTPVPHRPRYERCRAAIRERLGDVRFAEAWDQGARMTLADAVAEAQAVAARSVAAPSPSVPPSRQR